VDMAALTRVMLHLIVRDSSQPPAALPPKAGA
jgi:hypothetical protein